MALFVTLHGKVKKVNGRFGGDQRRDSCKRCSYCTRRKRMMANLVDKDTRSFLRRLDADELASIVRAAKPQIAQPVLLNGKVSFNTDDGQTHVVLIYKKGICQFALIRPAVSENNHGYNNSMSRRGSCRASF